MSGVTVEVAVFVGARVGVAVSVGVTVSAEVAVRDGVVVFVGVSVNVAEAVTVLVAIDVTVGVWVQAAAIDVNDAAVIVAFFSELGPHATNDTNRIKHNRR